MKTPNMEFAAMLTEFDRRSLSEKAGWCPKITRQFLDCDLWILPGEVMKKTRSQASSKTVVSLSGLLTGAAAGLIGVGGGEFRMPVLVRVLKFPIKIAAGMNLLIGLATVIVSLWRRWGQRAIVWEELTLASAM